MDYEYYLRYINKNTKKKYDVSTIAAHPEAFKNLMNDFSRMFKKDSYDVVVSQEASGFIFGAALAYKNKKAFVPLRKKGGLPTIATLKTTALFIDYSGKKKGLEINKGLLKKGARVLILDDWIESGAQVDAAIRLIEKQGAKIVGLAAIRVHKNARTKKIMEQYVVKALKIA